MTPVHAPARLPFIPAALACGLAAFLLWRWLGEPASLPAVPGGRLQCLSYTPFEPGELAPRAPGWVSPARIADDLDRLAPYTGCLRVYTPLGNTPQVLEAASRRGLTILLGAWIGSNLEQNDREIRAALDLARRYPGTVSAIVVGNEVLLRREMTGANLAALIREVKSQSPVPVAYADVAHFIATHPAVAEAADLLLIHLLPYWDDPAPPPVERAVGQVLQGLGEFRARFPGKAVMIGETGWPSAGRPRGPGSPGLVNQARFWREFAVQAEAAGVRYNLIEAIDQPWKRPPEGTVGGYWGLLDQHREPKFSLTGPVSEWPGWRGLALATGALSLVLLGVGMAAPLGLAGWLGWTVTAFTAALALVFQWRFALLTSQSPLGWLAAAGAVALSLAGLALLFRRCAGRPLQPPAPFADLGRSLAAPRTWPGARSAGPVAFAALLLLPMAWISLTLAFAPRHRDIPVAQFLVPALAAALCLRGTGRHGDRREEATLVAVVLGGALAQLEWRNAASAAWLLLAALAASPWLGSLGAELARVRGLLADARQAQQRDEGA